jgi:DNA-binding CsgD family transcriptional regulator
MSVRTLKVADELSQIRAQLGEAVIDGTKWRELLESMCRAIGAEGGSLRQFPNRTVDTPYTASMEQLTKIYFREGWNLRDTRVQTLVRRPVRSAAFVDSAVFTYDEMKSLFRRDPYFNDFLGLGKLKWSAWIQFRVGKHPWLMGFQRTDVQGPFESVDMKLIQPFSQSLSEAANLSAAVGHRVLSGVLDALSLVQWPAVALDNTGRVLGSNVSADEVFDSSISVYNGRLKVSDELATQRLGALYTRLRLVSEASSVYCDPIIVRRLQKPPIVLNVLPVPVAAKNPFLGARILLVFRDPSAPALTKPNVLQGVFGFTSAETKLALMLGGGDSLESAAQQLHLSRETVRTQLKSLFTKTETHRQIELIALLARFRI